MKKLLFFSPLIIAFSNIAFGIIYSLNTDFFRSFIDDYETFAHLQHMLLVISLVILIPLQVVFFIAFYIFLKLRPYYNEKL